MRTIFVLAVISLAVICGRADAQIISAPKKIFHFSPIMQRPAPLHRVGLWDKPNQACVTKCEVFVRKGCFTRLSEKDPTADPGAIQDKCDDKFSVCLYDCMCDTCDENMIIIKPPQ